MPITRSEIQEFTSSNYDVIRDLKEGVYYSKAEIAKELFGHDLAEKNAFLAYLPKKATKSGMLPIEAAMVALAEYTRDVTYLEAFLLVYEAKGDLIGGIKDGVLYYGKPQKPEI